MIFDGVKKSTSYPMPDAILSFVLLSGTIVPLRMDLITSKSIFRLQKGPRLQKSSDFKSWGEFAKALENIEMFVFSYKYGILFI